MGVFDRLGNVINSYFNDFGSQTNRGFRSPGSYNSGDPDLEAAFEELNDYLNDKEPRRERRHFENSGANAGDPKLPPRELRDDFEKLGVPFGADETTCKAAYKKLLKIHHPDRHAGHEGNFKKATEKMARINASYDRIEKWRETTKVK
jgi:hypothetical protein